MAKKIKFALKMNNVDVRSLETLRENFDFEKAAAYFLNGKLIEWLESRYYNEEAEKIRNLNKDDKNFGKNLCTALGVDYQGNTEIDLDTTAGLNEKLAKLKQLTADEEIISHAAQVAFSQEDLVYLLEKGESNIYLCGEQFQIPVHLENRKYIGILGKPEIKIGVENFEKLKAKSITFENVNLPENLSQPTPINESEIKKIIQGYAVIYGFDDQHAFFDADFFCGKIAKDSRVNILRNGKEIFSGGIINFLAHGSYRNLDKIDYIDNEKITRRISGNYYSGGRFAIKFNSIPSLENGDIIESYIIPTENVPFPKNKFVWNKRPCGSAKIMPAFTTSNSWPLFNSRGYMPAELFLGKFIKDSKVRVLRNDREIFTGTVSDLIVESIVELSEVKKVEEPDIYFKILVNGISLKEGDIIEALE